ncbi:MAG: VanZ family protein [Steroidobacteraceae bacterium]
MNPVLRPELRFRRLWFVMGLALAAFILVLCLLPGKDLPQIHLWDKFEHALAYVALAFLFGGIVIRRDYFWLGVSLVAFGGFIELLQAHVGRDAEWFDLLADAIGVVLGLLLALTPLGLWAHWIESRFTGSRA